MKVWAVIKYWDDGGELVGVYTNEEMAKEAVNRLGDNWHAEVTECEMDVLPENERKIEWYACIDINGRWSIRKGYSSNYIYVVAPVPSAYPVVYVRAGSAEEAEEMAEAEKKYWTKKGIYGCSRDHWETIKDQLRIK